MLAAVENLKQRVALETLASYIDMEETEVTPEEDGTVIFEGYSVDGLAVGIIQPSGKIDWVCGEIALV